MQSVTTLCVKLTFNAVGFFCLNVLNSGDLTVKVDTAENDESGLITGNLHLEYVTVIELISRGYNRGIASVDYKLLLSGCAGEDFCEGSACRLALMLGNKGGCEFVYNREKERRHKAYTAKDYRGH